MDAIQLKSSDKPVSESSFHTRKKIAHHLLLSGDKDNAWEKFYNLSVELIPFAGKDGINALFVSTSLELANVSFMLGKGFPELYEILLKASKVAGQIGDQRSHAMINLHLGRLFYFGGQRETAMTLFISGKNQVEALGDEDIIMHASEFIGLFYFIQGRFRYAIRYLEKAAQSYESGIRRKSINPSGPLWFSYCLAFLGQFHRAIGALDYYLRLSSNYGDINLACTLRAALGIILVGIRQQKKAYFHLSWAFQNSHQNNNAIAHYFAKGGLSFHHYMEGRFHEAADLLDETMAEGQQYGLIHQYASPIVLEVLFDLHRKGLLKDSAFNYEWQFERVMREPNIHLRGVAMRLSALESIDRGDPFDIAKTKLIQSEMCLESSGDPVQIGKTRIEMARLKIRAGEIERAHHYIRKARYDFGSYIDIFFPDDLRSLLAVKEEGAFGRNVDDELLKIFSDIMQEFSPKADFGRLLTRIVFATNRFFGAERGGIFFFDISGIEKRPALRGGCNLSLTDIESDDFKYSFSLILKAYNKKSPQVIRFRNPGLNTSKIKSLICVPFSYRGEIRGVLYHDNSYLKDCFDNWDVRQLSHIARWLTGYIDHFSVFLQKMEKINTGNLYQNEPPPGTGIITNSPVMLELLDRADKIAASDSSIVIYGETGVGKELLARRIHSMSTRSGKPLVVVDMTTIPENLVESELFGHEKGAFTGADNQKKGRVELAHKGTLFLDEIGEIAPSVQVKLLRTIQEKSFMRIGATRTMNADFRLISATNRDLAEEISKGRFREDLFYRLNVIPLTIPALRERAEDILLLAWHFIDLFSQKYNRKGLSLNKDQEAMLLNYEWPGNIREIQNIMERAVLLSSGNSLHLNLPMKKQLFFRQEESPEELPTLDELQRRYIRQVLAYTQHKISGPRGAADILGMKRTTLINRMKKLGLK